MKKEMKEKQIYIRQYLFKPTGHMSIGVIPIRDSKSEIKYYIQIHSCPHPICSTQILTCSCLSFQIQKPSEGIDSFHDPCKHICELQTITEWKKKWSSSQEIF